MPIVPETRVGKISFYETHLPAWAQDPASIGLTADAVDQLQQRAVDAREAFIAHQRALETARSATMSFHMAVRRLHAGGDGVAGGATLLQQIKTYAQTTGDNAVFDRALISAPAKPGRPGSAPVPGTPYRFKTNVSQSGEVELTWKCDNPQGTVGTIYQIARKIDNEPMTRVAMVGEKKFLDRTVPPGSRSCTYQVTALRSTGKGRAAYHTIQFGNAHPMPQFEIKSRRLVA